MKLAHEDTVAVLDHLLKSEPKAKRPAGFTIRLKRLCDLVAATGEKPLTLASIASEVFPKVSQDSLRATLGEFRKELSATAAAAGLRLELIRPDGRSTGGDEIICHFEGTPLPRGRELKAMGKNANPLAGQTAVSDEERTQLHDTAVNAAAVRPGTPLVRARIAACNSSDLARLMEVPLSRSTDGRERLRFFVSYAHKDADQVTRLLDLLIPDLSLSKRFTYDFWRDHRILAGEGWNEEIQDALRDCDFGLALVSREFLSSSYITKHELPAFVSGEKPLIPVCLGLLDLGRQDLRGLEEQQIYRYPLRADDLRCFGQCTGTVAERFVSDLARAIEARAEKTVQARKEAIAMRALAEPELLAKLAAENPKFHAAILDIRRDLETRELPAVELTEPAAPSVQPPAETPRAVLLHSFGQHQLPEDSGTKVKAAAGCLNLAAAEKLIRNDTTDAVSALESRRTDAVRFLTDWFRDPAQPPFAAVLGEIGSGKTTMLQMLARALATGSVHDAPPVFFVDLRDYTGDTDPTLEHLLADQLRRHDTSGKLTVRDLLDAVQTGGALIIFDGLDEKIIPLADGPRQRFIGELFRVLPPEFMDRPASSGRGRIIISCRSHYFPSVLALTSGLTDQQRSTTKPRDYTACFMLPWTDAQVADYLAQTLGKDRVGAALEIIGSVHNLTDLSRRPYLLSLIAPQIEDLERERATGHPVNGALLYQKFVEKWLLRDEGKHQFTKEHKRLMMERLAVDLWRENAREWPWSRVAEWLDTFLYEHPAIAARYARSNVPADILNQDFRTATFFLRPDFSKDGFRFAHTSLQEFFLASLLIKSLPKPNATAAWDLPMPSRETFDFMRQILEAMSENERSCALEGLKTLLENPAHPKQTRQVALKLLLHQSKTGMPVPENVALAAQGLDLQSWEFTSKPESPLSLNHADFTGAVLYDAKFLNIELSKSRWPGAFGANMEFVNCGLEEASFEGDGISLQGTRFRRCRLGSSRLNSISLDGVRVDLPIWDEVTASHWRAILRQYRSTEAGPPTRPWFVEPVAECTGNTVDWPTSRTYISKGFIRTSTSLGVCLEWDEQTGIPTVLPGMLRSSLNPGTADEKGGIKLTISNNRNLQWKCPDGTELESAVLPGGGYAVLQRRSGGQWRLVRAKGDYWRYVNYVEDTPAGRILHTADALGEPERLADGTFVWPEHEALPD